MEIDMEKSGPERHCLMTVTRGLLFMFNLDACVTEDVLREFLQPFGRFHWCRIVVNAEGKPTGNAYAKFENDEDIMVFMKERKFLQMESLNNGRSPAALPSYITACTRLTDAGKLLISGLDSSVTQEALADELMQYGELNSVQLFSNSTQAVVHYTSELFARAAISGLEKPLCGKKVTVTLYNDVPPRTSSLGQKRILLKPFNLRYDVDNVQLGRMFSFLGSITARVERDAYTQSRGCGYVMFDYPPADTPLFLSFVPYTTPDGGIVLASRYSPQRVHKRPPTEAKYMRFSSTATPSARLHNALFNLPLVYGPYKSDLPTILGLPPDNHVAATLPAYHVHVNRIGDRDETTLRKLFERYGEVISCLMWRVPVSSEPYAIVTFKHRTAAVLAVEYSRMIRSTGTEVNATMLDTYQYFHQLAPPPTTYSTPSNDYVQKLHKFSATKNIPVSQVTKMMDARIKAIAQGNTISPVDFETVTAQFDKMHIGKENSAKQGTPSSSAVAKCEVAVDDTFTNETFRPVIVDKIAKLFARSSAEKKAEMLKMAMETDLQELSEILMDDEKFRRHFIAKAVAAAKKLQNK